MQCIPDPDDPNRECKTCGDVRKESKKVVHRLPCLRWKIMDIVLSRIDAGPLGSLRLTERWQGFTLRDVSEWVGEGTRTINITLGICSIPLVLQVRKFKPRTGDVTYRCWRDGNNEKRVELAPYALASIKGTTQSLKEYLNANALKTLEAGCRDQNNDQLIRETYWWVIRQHENLKVRKLHPSFPEYLVRPSRRLLTQCPQNSRLMGSRTANNQRNGNSWLMFFGSGWLSVRAHFHQLMPGDRLTLSRAYHRVVISMRNRKARDGAQDRRSVIPTFWANLHSPNGGRPK